MSDLKPIHVIGQTDLRMNTRKRGRKRKEGGGEEYSQNQQQNQQHQIQQQQQNHINIVKGIEQSSVASTASSVNSNKWLHIPQQPPAPPIIQSHPISLQQNHQGQQQQGGSADTRHIKVELKRNTTQKRVHLNPKKSHNVPKKNLKAAGKLNKTRKVTLGIKSLKKRLTRANKLKEKVSHIPIAKLKEQLIQKGLIKSTSKAPESVLRQIATDAQIVATKSL